MLELRLLDLAGKRKSTEILGGTQSIENLKAQQNPTVTQFLQ